MADIEIVHGSPVPFSSLMWNDHFIIAGDLLNEPGQRTLLMATPQVVAGGKKYNAVQVDVGDNAAQPFWNMNAETMVFKVVITKIEVKVEG